MAHENKIGTVVVTGGHGGIGLECTRSLVAAGAHVVLGARNPEQATRALGDLATAAVEVLALDLASLASVRAFSDQLAAGASTRPPFRGLVCNAGVQIVGAPQRTQDGFEMTFGVNHLGHYLLLHRLLPQLVSPARIAIVASGTHDPKQHSGVPVPNYGGARVLVQPGGAARADDGVTRAGQRAYSTSKLCNILCAYALAERLKVERPDVTVVAYDPGAVPGTGLVRQYGATAKFLWNRVLGALIPVLRYVIHIERIDLAGKYLARLVIDPQLTGTTGVYFAGMRQIRSSDESYERDKQEELFVESAALVELTPAEAGVSVVAPR